MTAARRLVQVVHLHQRSFWRNPESAFFHFAMPLAVLVIYGSTVANAVVPGRHGARVLTLFVPGVLGFAVVVVAYANLAATIASQRAGGFLKRLRATPMDPAVYIAGQLLSILAITLAIALATVGLGAAAFHALPRPAAVPELVVVLVVGISCFAALGLAITAVIPSAEAAGPVTNGTYLPLAMVSGMFSATLRLPSAVSAIIDVLPFRALADGLRQAYEPGASGFPVQDLVVLAGWGVAGVVLAARFFRWDP